MPTRTSTRKGSGRRRVSSKTSSKTRKKSPPKKTVTQKLAAARDSVRNTLGRQTDDVWGMVLLVSSVLTTLAFFKLAGPVGDGFGTGSRFLFGVWRYAVPIALAGIGLALIIGKPREGARRLVVGGITTFIGTLALFHLLTGAVAFRSSLDLVQERGGAVGSLIAFPLRRVLGHWGAFVVLASVVGMGVLVMTNTSVRDLFQGLGQIWRNLRKFAGEIVAGDPDDRGAHIARPVPVVEQKPRGKHQKPAEQRPPKAPKAPAEKAPASRSRRSPSTSPGATTNCRRTRTSTGGQGER